MDTFAVICLLLAMLGMFVIVQVPASNLALSCFVLACVLTLEGCYVQFPIALDDAGMPVAASRECSFLRQTRFCADSLRGGLCARAPLLAESFIALRGRGAKSPLGSGGINQALLDNDHGRGSLAGRVSASGRASGAQREFSFARAGGLRSSASGGGMGGGGSGRVGARIV